MANYATDQDDLVVTESSTILRGTVIGRNSYDAVTIRNGASLTIDGTVLGRNAGVVEGMNQPAASVYVSASGRVTAEAFGVSIAGTLTNGGYISGRSAVSANAAINSGTIVGNITGVYAETSITNFGSIVTGPDAFLGVNYAAAAIDITNSGSIVSGGGTGADASGTLVNRGRIDGATLGARAVTATNSGSITSAQTALEATTVTNRGSIVGGTIGVTATNVTNSGDIAGDNTALIARTVTNTGDISSTKIALALGGELTNAGSIIGDIAIRINANTRVTIRNSGDILATGSTAIDGSGARGGFILTNDGRINASDMDHTAIGGGQGVDSVTNNGSIVGNIMLAAAADRYDGTNGTVAGLVDLGAGDDTGIGGAANDRISGGSERDTLRGGGGDDALDGGTGDDLLDGGTGVDRLVGGTGDDVYYVDNARDAVIERADGGRDTVYALASYTLRAGVEVETLRVDPTSDILGLALVGNGFVQLIVGDAGANRITGGGGADTLIGLAGDDIYVVGNSGVTITEAANGGIDTVIASVGYALADNVEIAQLSPATGTDALDLSGNTLDNILYGNAGDNVLDGGTGADRMVGGLGNDTYYVDTLGDVVADGGGNDTVHSTIDFTLSAAIETLILDGSADIDAIGNALANTITGNDGANVLSGRGGIDMLTGGLGDDIFLFATKATAGTLATISDFGTGADRIALDDAAFRRVGGPGILDDSVFTTGEATTRDHHILFDSATGTLSYDIDGSGTAYAAVAFAMLQPGVTLTAADILVV